MHLTIPLRLLAVSGVVALTVAGCASQSGVSRDSLDSSIAINYGTTAQSDRQLT